MVTGNKTSTVNEGGREEGREVVARIVVALSPTAAPQRQHVFGFNAMRGTFSVSKTVTTNHRTSHVKTQANVYQPTARLLSSELATPAQSRSMGASLMLEIGPGS